MIFVIKTIWNIETIENHLNMNMLEFLNLKQKTIQEDYKLENAIIIYAKDCTRKISWK